MKTTNRSTRIPSPRQALPLMLALALGACASSGSTTGDRTVEGRTTVGGAGFGSVQLYTEPGTGERNIRANVADVWAVLPGAYEQLGIPVGYTEEGRKELGNRGYRARRIDGARMSKYFRCGTSMTGALADEYNLTVTVRTRVTANADGGATILTTADAIGRPRATSGDPVRCESAGQLELRIAQVVAEVLEG